MNIAILGAGNSGLGMAAHLSSLGFNVRLWNRSANRLSAIVQNGALFASGIVEQKLTLALVTLDLNAAVEDADLIIITTPATAHTDIARQLAQSGLALAPILLSPGRTLGAYCFKNEFKQLGRVCVVAEAQTVIHTCRDIGQGRVHIFSIKPLVELAAIEDGEADKVLAAMPAALRQHFSVAESWINTSLGNIGYVLHCAPMLLNTGWIENTHQRFNFYRDGISPKVAEFIEQLDCERLKVASALGVQLDSIHHWLYKMYGTPLNSLHTMLQYTAAYQFIEAPDNMSHRYLQEDIPCGLVPLESLARQYSVNTPATTALIDLASILLKQDYREIGRKIPKELEIL